MREKDLEPLGSLGGASRLSEPLPIGTMTDWGVIGAVGMTGGERYYWMLEGDSVAMIPGCTVEQAHAARSAPPTSSAEGPTS